jgi:hypothetical protein
MWPSAHKYSRLAHELNFMLFVYYKFISPKDDKKNRARNLEQEGRIYEFYQLHVIISMLLAVI